MYAKFQGHWTSAFLKKRGGGGPFLHTDNFAKKMQFSNETLVQLFKSFEFQVLSITFELEFLSSQLTGANNTNSHILLYGTSGSWKTSVFKVLLGSDQNLLFTTWQLRY